MLGVNASATAKGKRIMMMPKKNHKYLGKKGNCGVEKL